MPSGAGGNVFIFGGETTDGDAGHVEIGGSDAAGSNRNGGSFIVFGGIPTGSGSGGDAIINTVAQGSAAQAARHYINATSKALTNATATNLFEVDLPASTFAGGTVTLSVRATDNTDFQSTTVMFTYAAVNKAGTITSQSTLASANTSTATSVGTLVVTASVLNGASKITLRVTATSVGITPTTFDATYQILNDCGQDITIV